MTETAPARRGASSARRRPPEPQPELSFDDIASEDTVALVARGSAYMRRYAEIQGQSTTLLRNVAVVLVALRARHITGDGSADLLGKSQPYRDDAAEVYNSAGLAPDSQDTVQSAVRYHIGNILRDVYDTQTLVAYGLTKDSPLERIRDNKRRTAALVTAARAEAESVDAVSASDPPSPTATADHLHLANGVLGILTSLSQEHIRDRMTDGQRAKLDGRLAEAQEVIRRLRRITKTRSS